MASYPQTGVRSIAAFKGSAIARPAHVPAIRATPVRLVTLTSTTVLASAATTGAVWTLSTGSRAAARPASVVHAVKLVCRTCSFFICGSEIADLLTRTLTAQTGVLQTRAGMESAAAPTRRVPAARAILAQGVARTSTSAAPTPVPAAPASTPSPTFSVFARPVTRASAAKR